MEARPGADDRGLVLDAEPAIRSAPPNVDRRVCDAVNAAPGAIVATEAAGPLGAAERAKRLADVGSRPARLIDFVFHSATFGRTVMPGSLSPWPQVRIGANGHPIKTLQYLLRARGHSVAVDGMFGPQTDAAVKAFQLSRGLTPDGIVSAAAWLTLIVKVRKGDDGEAVKGVQEEFQFRNGSGDPNIGLKIDGAFGPMTDATVRGFQQALSLDIAVIHVDGIVGPLTWQALVSGMLSG